MSYDFDLDVPPDLVAPAEVIKYPAFEGNLGGYGRPNIPKALVLHTPEEAKDNNEVTPRWFADPRARASTHYYADDDGDLIQMVADADCAWAQGTLASTSWLVTSGQRRANRHWKGTADQRPPWGEAGISNNCRALSIEIEGRAADFEWTAAQRFTVLMWIAHKAAQYDIPIDRDHIVGHEELATDKRDPGIAYDTFDIDELVADARALNIGKKPPAIGRWQLVHALVQNRVTTVPLEYRGTDRVYTTIVRQ